MIRAEGTSIRPIRRPHSGGDGPAPAGFGIVAR